MLGTEGGRETEHNLKYFLEGLAEIQLNGH